MAILKEDIKRITVSEFTEQIKEIYKKHFPLSAISVSFSNSLYASIWVKCFLAGDKSENSGNYWDNDMMNVKFHIGLKRNDNSLGEMVTYTKDSEIEHELCIENEGKSYNIKPIKDIHCVYNRTTLSYRKTHGEPKKIIASFDKFCKQLKESLIKDLQNDIIHDNHKELLQKKLGL